MRGKNVIFIALTAVALAAALPPLLDLYRSGIHFDYYSHIPLIPAVSAYVLFRRRKEIFKSSASFHPLGAATMAAAAGFFLAVRPPASDTIGRAAVASLAALVFWWGAYVALHEKSGRRRVLFPFAFLLFAVPVPVAAMERIIAVLLAGSTLMTRALFEALGIPLVQEGALFRLPGFGVEIARECSGIRSSLALLITTVVAGQLFLRRPWQRALLALAVLPVAVFKNAVRIVTLYLLSYFVDIRIIEGGFLHRSGGFLFFGLGLFALGLILLLIKGLGARPEKA